MRFARFRVPAGQERIGLVLDHQIFDLTTFVERCWTDKIKPSVVIDNIGDLLQRADEIVSLVEPLLAQIPSRHAKWLMPLASVTLLPPVGSLSKNIFCVGRNYIEHVAEGDQAQGRVFEKPLAPQFFTKPPTTIVGPEDAVPHHEEVTGQLDYEVELAVIIGKSGINIDRNHALDHIFGYSVINDITARDLQRRHGQWFKGKALDGSCPFGPCIVHKSAWSHREPHGIRLAVNGELRQQSQVDQMIFSIEEIIESLSSGMTLQAGDIIATGTPSGVGYARTPPKFLKDGDVVIAEIEGIGTLRNSISRIPPTYRTSTNPRIG